MTNERIIEQTDGIYTVDTGFHRPGLVASHLIIEQGRAAFVDVGVATQLPVLLQALDTLGVAREDVDWVLVTHVHLDHAGAAGALMRELPNAQLVVHPRGGRHMVDPSKLVAGATAVYGEDQMRREFGDILPVDADRVVEAPDGHRLALNGRTLEFLDTPGHAKHHYCVYDERSQGFFTGDTFGLSYRALDTAQGPFMYPTTTPVQFDPDALHSSIDRLMSYAPRRMFLTHFGCVSGPGKLADQLHARIDELVGRARAVSDRPAGAEREQALEQTMIDHLGALLDERGMHWSREQLLEVMGMDIGLNAQGLDLWLQKD